MPPPTPKNLTGSVRKDKDEEEFNPFLTPDSIAGAGIATNKPATAPKGDDFNPFLAPDLVTGSSVRTNFPSGRPVSGRAELALPKADPAWSEELKPYSSDELADMIPALPMHPNDHLKHLRALPSKTPEDEVRKQKTIREMTGLGNKRDQILSRWHRENPKGRAAFMRMNPEMYFDPISRDFKALPRTEVTGATLGGTKDRSRVWDFFVGLPENDIKEWGDRSGFERYGILGLMPDTMAMNALGLDDYLDFKDDLSVGREAAGGIAGWEAGRKYGKPLGIRGQILGGAIGASLGFTLGRASVKGELPTGGEQIEMGVYGTLGHGKMALPLAKRLIGGVAEGYVISDAGQRSQEILDGLFRKEGEGKKSEELPGDWQSQVTRNLAMAAGNVLFRGVQRTKPKGWSKERFLTEQAEATRQASINIIKAEAKRWSKKVIAKKTKGKADRAGEHRDWMKDVIKRMEDEGVGFEPKSQHEALMISQTILKGSGIGKAMRESLDAAIVNSAKPLAWAIATGSAREVPEIIRLMKRYNIERTGTSGAVRDSAEISDPLKKLLSRIARTTDDLPDVPESADFLTAGDKARRQALTFASPWGAFQRKVDMVYGKTPGSGKYNLEWSLENRGINAKQLADVAKFDEDVTSVLSKDRSLYDDFNSYALIQRIKKRLNNEQSRVQQMEELDDHVKVVERMVLKKDRPMFGKGPDGKKELAEYDKYLGTLKRLKKKLSSETEDRIYADLGLDGEATFYHNSKSGKGAKGINIDDMEREFLNKIKVDPVTGLPDPSRLLKLENIGTKFQDHAKRIRDLYVESGLFSKKGAKELGDKHDVYYPFAHVEHLADVSGIPAPLAGINRSWMIGDIVEQMRHQIAFAREQAEQNMALSDLISYGQKDLKLAEGGGGLGMFLRRTSTKKDASGDVIPPQEGWKTVTLKVDGHVEKFDVDESVAHAFHIFADPLILRKYNNFIARRWRDSAKLAKAGQTKYSIPFQLVNAGMSDALTNALTAKSGIRWYGLNPVDWVEFGADNLWGFYTAVRGNASKTPKGFYLEALESGLLRTTLDSAIDPLHKVHRLKPFSGKVEGVVSAASKGKDIIDILPNAIEEMGKLVHLRRTVRHEGAKSLTDLLKNNDHFAEAILRNEALKQAGSPQFSRFGEAAATLDNLFMFYNARMQGNARDLYRVTNWKSPEGRAAMARMMNVITAPTAYLTYYNLKNYPEELDKVPRQIRDNYWIIFKPNFVEDELGNEMRDYYRIPKRDIFKLVANMVEMGMGQMFNDDPKSVLDWGKMGAAHVSPINFEGDSISESAETFISGMHPVIRYGMERAAGRGGGAYNIREMWTHRYLVPRDRGSASDPSVRHRRNTAEGWNKAAAKLGNVVGGEDLQHLVKTFTGDMFTQFAPSKPVEGRADWENDPLIRMIGRRFIAPTFAQNQKMARNIELEEGLAQTVRARTSDTAREWLDKNLTTKRGEPVSGLSRRGILAKADTEFKDDPDVRAKIRLDLIKYIRGSDYDKASLKRLASKYPPGAAKTVADLIKQFKHWKLSDEDITKEIWRMEDDGILTLEVWAELGIDKGFDRDKVQKLLERHEELYEGASRRQRERIKSQKAREKR